MEINLCIPTIKSFDTLVETIRSANAGSVPPSRIAVIDNSCGKFIEYMQEREAPENLIVINPSMNLGVAESWNAFMRTFNDFVILSNDDVVFRQDTLEKLVGAAMTHADTGFFYPHAQTDNAYSLFLLRNWLYETIGDFDASFFPAYFEDNDWDYRRRLGNHKIMKVDGCFYDHVGSSTLKLFTQQERNQHDASFRKNRAYYLRKWGGEPGMESYTEPFDGKVYLTR